MMTVAVVTVLSPPLSCYRHNPTEPYIREPRYDGPIMQIIHVTSREGKASIMKNCWMKGSGAGSDRSMSWEAPEGASLAVQAGCKALQDQVITCFQICDPDESVCCPGFGEARVHLDIGHHLRGKWYLCIPEEPNPGNWHDFWNVYLVKVGCGTVVLLALLSMMTLILYK